MTTYCLICAPDVITDDATFSLGKSCPNCRANEQMLQVAVTLVHIEDFEPMDTNDQNNSLDWTDDCDGEWEYRVDLDAAIELDDHDDYVYTDAVVETEPEWVYVPDTLDDYTE